MVTQLNGQQTCDVCGRILQSQPWPLEGWPCGHCDAVTLPGPEEWIPEDLHLMWVEIRGDGKARRVRCVTCGPLYAREAHEKSAVSADKVRHLSRVARADATR